MTLPIRLLVGWPHKKRSTCRQSETSGKLLRRSASKQKTFHKKLKASKLVQPLKPLSPCGAAAAAIKAAVCGGGDGCSRRFCAKLSRWPRPWLPWARWSSPWIPWAALKALEDDRKNLIDQRCNTDRATRVSRIVARTLKGRTRSEDVNSEVVFRQFTLFF